MPLHPTGKNGTVTAPMETGSDYVDADTLRPSRTLAGKPRY